MTAMDFEDKNDPSETKEKSDLPGSEETQEASTREGEGTDRTAESPEGGVRPADKDHKKHEKGDPEDARAMKGKLKKKEHEIKHLRKENDDLKNENSNLKDKYLRAAAEMDNQRKRLEREKNDFYQFALSDLLKELLAVLDNFERALKSQENQTDGKNFHEGIELIRKQLFDLLLKRGLTPLDAQNKKFDPAVHQAVLTEESDAVKEPEVGEILQKGYLLNERLLRPALVKVIVPKKN
ncbi:MAG: nucleotide exchange factor GrpE [Candidatus Aminicenantes bacterium]|nr:nucleotide exchange factor GrpE [Candidatus Aminicenantes bacterium]